MGDPVSVLALAFVIGYLVAGAILALATVGQPRRAFDLPLSLAIAATRVLLALALLVVLLQVTS